MKQFAPLPARPQLIKDPGVYRSRYCTCGHYWFEHKTGSPERYKNFKHWLTSFGNLDGACKECLCPDYDELGEFSAEEMAKIKEDSIQYGTVS